MVVFNVYGVNVILEEANGYNYDLFYVIDGLNRLDSLDFDSKEYGDIYHTIADIVNRRYDDSDDFKCLYWQLDSYEHNRYYEHSIKDFREYAKRKNEPDFDWDFYSDWHKDIYGFRPHH